jgi:hypothetical protein
MEEVGLKSFVVAAAVAVFMLVAAEVAAAQGEYTVERTAVQFTLSSDTCSRLPAGATITGKGRQKSVTRTIADAAGGVTTVVNYTRASGRATDADGNRYRFDYRNAFHIQNSTASPAIYSGTMFDLFALAGRGPARLRNGFVAIFTTDLGDTASFQPLYSWGDPIEVPTGAAHCDPL